MEAQTISPQVIRFRRNQQHQEDLNVQALELEEGVLQARAGKRPSATETTPLPESHSSFALVPEEEFFGYFSTSALILNKMFGTGIFVTPTLILALTNSKSTSLMIWLFGSLMTWAGMIVYLEYGIRFPLNGGELYYIDYIWTKPKMLLTYVYAFPFLIISGTIATGLTFGKAIIISATPEGARIDPRLQKFFAVLVVGTVCLLQGGLTRANYIRFNNLFAIYKILLLSFFTIAGWCALGGLRTASAATLPGPYGKVNLRPDFDQTVFHPYTFAVALLNIQRVFLGYENANFVLEEVRRQPGDGSAVYRRAAKLTVVTVAFFYLMVNIAFFAVCDTATLIATPDTLTLFFQRLLGPSGKARRAAGALQAISAFGNMMSYIYSNVRVKQEIARLGIVPVPQYFAKTNARGAPQPALILTFVFTSIVILATPLSDANGYLIISTLFSYVRTFIALVLSLGLLAAPFLRAFRFDDRRPWSPQARIGGLPVLVPMVLLYLCANLFVLALSWWPADVRRYLQTKSPVLPPLTGPAIGTALLVAGALYWAWDLHVLRWLGWNCEITESEPEDGVIRMHVSRELAKPAWTVYKWVADFCTGCHRAMQRVQELWNNVSRHL